MSSGKNVLSIQSHVTHGYVGNKIATFSLQLHGFDVDGINTVSLSNHSGYPFIRGHRMDLQEYLTLLEGLRLNGFLAHYNYVLSGYINNKEIVKYLENTIAEIRKLRCDQGLKDIVYFCDPVMGDDGKFYCKEDIIEAYQHILPLADILTPNYFEASMLSGVEVKDLRSAIAAANWFHTQGTACVVIKSFRIPDDPHHLQFLISMADKYSEDGTLIYKKQRYEGVIPYYEGRYTGTGDIFASSLLAFYHSNPLPVAVGKAMGILQDLLLETRRKGGDGSSSIAARELRVTDFPQNVLCPSCEIEVRPLEWD